MWMRSAIARAVADLNDFGHAHQHDEVLGLQATSDIVDAVEAGGDATEVTGVGLSLVQQRLHLVVVLLEVKSMSYVRLASSRADNSAVLRISLHLVGGVGVVAVVDELRCFVEAMRAGQSSCAAASGR